MLRNLASRLARFNTAIEEVMRKAFPVAGPGSNLPPPALAFDMAPSTAISGQECSPALGSRTLEELVADLRTLWGVPKYRTSKPKKQTRKFAYTRLFTPITGVTQCPVCGSHHEHGTICGKCYEKVMELTDKIKKTVVAFNPLKGSLPSNKPLQVRFNDDPKIEGVDENGIKDGVRILELKRPRPSWFQRGLLPNSTPTPEHPEGMESAEKRRP